MGESGAAAEGSGFRDDGYPARPGGNRQRNTGLNLSQQANACDTGSCKNGTGGLATSRDEGTHFVHMRRGEGCQSCAEAWIFSLFATRIDHGYHVVPGMERATEL